MSYEYFDRFILPLSIFLGSWIVGFIFDSFVFKYLKKVTQKTKLVDSYVIIDSFHHKPILWFGILGLYLSIQYLQINLITESYILKLLTMIFILSVTKVLVNITVGFINLYLRKKEGAFPSASIFTNIAKVFIYILGILIVLQSFGISITPLLTALGVGGLAVALALQDTLSNLFAGLQILASKQIKPGDYVKLSSGEDGVVNDITWRNTSIIQLSNNVVIIPNSKISSSLVTNYSRPDDEVNFSIPINVKINNDLKYIEELTMLVANQIVKETDKSAPGFIPIVRFQAFLDSNIHFNVGFRAKDLGGQSLITHIFLKKLHEVFKEKGIQM